MTAKKTPADALAELEAIVGPLAWGAKWEPPADQADIAKAVGSIHKAMRRLKKVNDRQAAMKKCVICRECQEEFEFQECANGVCSDCDREPCPTCDGTGLNPEPDFEDEDMNSDCPDCGGDGLI